MSNKKFTQVNFAIEYAQMFGIGPRKPEESFYQFAVRVAIALRRQEKFEQAHEVFQNHSAHESYLVNVGVIGAIKKKKNGTEEKKDNWFELVDDLTVGFQALESFMEYSDSDLEKMLKTIDAILSSADPVPATGPDARYPSAKDRVFQLRAQGKTGKEIAQVLLDEDYSIEDATFAFITHGYVTSTQNLADDIKELHVSDNPGEAGMAAYTLSALIRTHPSVVWKKSPPRPSAEKRIEELYTEWRQGQSMAKQLLQEGYTLQEAYEGFKARGFLVEIKGNTLLISDHSDWTSIPTILLINNLSPVEWTKSTNQ